MNFSIFGLIALTLLFIPSIEPLNKESGLNRRFVLSLCALTALVALGNTIYSAHLGTATERRLNDYIALQAQHCENTCANYPWEDQEDYKALWNTKTMECECTVILEQP